MNKKQIEKLSKMTKSDREFRSKLEQIRDSEKKQNHKNMISLIKMLGIAAGALVVGLAIFGLVNNVSIASTPKYETVKAVLKTTKGDVTLELNKSAAPKTVENFINMAKAGHYDNSFFNRIIKDGIIQGGVPMDGKPYDGKPAQSRPGYKATQPFELSSLKHERWAVSMASTNGEANKSFFNICLSAQPKLDGKGVVFGKVIDGFDAITKLTNVKLIAQVRNDEIFKDKDGNPAKNQEHNATIYEVDQDEVSRPEEEAETRITGVEIIE